MNWHDVIGGVVNKATGAETSAAQTEPQEASGLASSSLLGSVIGTAFTSFNRTGLVEELNGVTSFLSPELKADLVASALDKIGASGTDVQALLSQLGINPAISNNPEEATTDELARLSEHLQQSDDNPMEESAEVQDLSNETTDVHEEQTSENREED
jgi:hypothetical protein